MITGMLLASIGLAGCGKKSEDDITNKEIYQDDLEPLTEEELNEMDADTSDEDMKQIDEPEEETADIQILQMQQKLQIKRKIQIKQKLQILLQKNLRIKLKHQILQIQRNQKLKRKLKNNYKGASLELLLRQPPDHISVIIRKEPRSSVRSHP